jgi:hypothetical protein
MQRPTTAEGRIPERWLRSPLRNLGRQVLEIVISGGDTPEHADGAFRREIGAMIQT